MTKDDKDPQPFGGESVTHHVTSEVTPPESRIATSSVTSSPPKAMGSRDTGDVELYMAYPNDRFKFGEGEDDVLVGHKTRKFSRSEADRILGLARMSNLQVLERKPEDNS